MRSQDVRERFLRFFEERGHHRLPSASLIPHDDPSLLFTVAGMVPLKPYIAGSRAAPSQRLVSCQKCFRGAGLKYDDIASVGDATHHTFFEMLGNWSIGDYFKEGAIDLAWELSTQVFRLDAQRIWVSVYPDDTVSELYWADHIGVPRERIVKLTDNWWAAGPTGPCGYDSELYWDHGPPCSCGRESCTPADECGGDRWVEYWNLVFMEFDQQDDGSRPLLPKATVDTGMGLERMTAVLQGVRSDYETDLFRPLIDDFRQRASAPSLNDAGRSFNVLADHLRGAAFLIAAGVLPGNEGRDYVLRRLVRRAAIHARRVGVRGGLAEGVDALVEVMGDAYAELREHRLLITETLRSEETTFDRTLAQGTRRFESLVESGSERIAGSDAFRLYDTYGLPIELTVEMAGERGVDVDVPGFLAAMEGQRERSRSATAQVGFTGEALPGTTFVGYDTLTSDARVVRIGIPDEREALPAAETALVILDVSPFYAEAGGQIGDTGTLTWDGGRATVLDTTYVAAGDARVHAVRVDDGALRRGTTVHTEVDTTRRSQTARHHSATHLLNRALREVFGNAVVQRGSYVAPDHTTFDFSFNRALEPEELARLEHLVNDAVRRDLDRTVSEMPLAEARASGAVALLDENYSELVRVVDFGGWSRELCGGTHVRHTGEVGAAIIVSESSIGQGVRRIDMVAGAAAEARWRETTDALQTTARALRARLEEVPARVVALQEQVKKLTKDIEQARRAAASGGGMSAATHEDVAGIPLVHAIVNGDGVRETADRLFAERLQGDGVTAVLGRSQLAVKVGGRALDAGVDAAELVRLAAGSTGGGGGGSRQFGQGGVKDAAKREAALAAIREAVQRAATTS
ncbi:MAG: alanine--tRNA ligase [Candidatus Dormibacteria bacterium]